MKFLSAYNAAHASVLHCCHHSCFCMVHYVSITLWWQPVVFKEKQIKFWCRFSSSCISSFCFGHFFCWRGKRIFSKSSLKELSNIYKPLYFSADCLSFTDKFKSSREKKMGGTRGINHTEQANQNSWELHRLEWSYISRKVHVSLCHRLHSRGSEVCSYDAPVAYM